MTTPTDDDRSLLTVIAHMKALPGKEQDLRDLLESLVEPTLSEDGCVNYDLHVAEDDPGRFFFYENWTGGDELDAHLGAPHLQDAVGRLDELLEGGAGGLIITRLKRIK